MRYEFKTELAPVRPKPVLLPQNQRMRVPPIRRTLVLAYQIADYMKANKITMLSDFCLTAHITRARATQIMNMLHLSSRIQEEILIADDLNLSGLREETIRPLLKEIFWSDQDARWRKILISIRHGAETTK